MLKYMVNLEDEGDNVSVSFPDVPHAFTCGTDRADAMRQAVDCLITALILYQDSREIFPLPKHEITGDFVRLPIVPSLKVFLHNTMIEKKIRKSDLSKITGWSGTQIERVLDPMYQSKIPLIEFALNAMGKDVEAKIVNF